jgi:opacity protein-like surface antigen
MRHLTAGALLAIAFSGAAQAAAPEPAEGTETVAPAPEPAGPFAGSKVADEEALGRATAREDVSIVNETEHTSSVTNSTVTGAVNGEINLSDNAFQNATGLTVINANTGNNVAMNASLSVSVVMTSPE